MEPLTASSEPSAVARQPESVAPPAVASAAEPVLAEPPLGRPLALSPVPPAFEKQAEPTPPPPVTQQSQYKDGTYLGWGTCRHGDIQASVVQFRGGQIAAAAIATCATRYPCSGGRIGDQVAALSGQVVARQSPNVDFISGATQSSNAFSDAVTSALSKAHE